MTSARVGFARSGRAVEQDAGQGVGGEHASEHPAFAEEVLLADELVERPRPHADGQRLSGGTAFFFLVLPEVGHRSIVAGGKPTDGIRGLPGGEGVAFRCGA